MKRVESRLAALALLLLVAVSAMVWARRDELALDVSAGVLLSGDARASAAYGRLDEAVGRQVVVGLLVQHDDLFTDAGRDALAALGDDLAALPAVTDVKALTHSPRPVKHGFSFDLAGMVASERFLPRAPQNDLQWERLRATVLADPLARDVFVDATGTLAVVMATAAGLDDAAAVDAFLADVLATAEVHRGAFLEVLPLGFPFIEREVGRLVREDALRLGAVGAVLLTTILLWVFRSPLVVGLVLALSAVGAAGVPWLLQLTGAGLNVYTALLLPLTAGLQLTLLMHFVSALQRGRRATDDEAARLRGALLGVTPPSVIAALTTAIGLFSLRFCELGLVRDFGTVGALASALVLAVSLGPAWALSLVMGPGAWHGGMTVRHSAGGSAPPRVEALDRRRRGVITAAALVVAAALPGIASLDTDVRASEFLATGSDGRRVLQRLDQDFGGYNVFALEVDSGRDGGVHERGVLQFMESLRAEAEALPWVSHVYSISTLHKRLNQLWNDDDPDAYRLPSSDLQIALVGRLVQVVPVPLKEVLVDRSGRVATLLVRTRDMPADAYLALIDLLLQSAEGQRPEGVELRLQAGVHDLLAADRRLLASQVDSLAGCALAVLFALVVLLRSVRHGLIVLVANLVPLAAVLGVMGYAGVGLNSITIMVASVALGVAVDDGVHLVSWMQRRPGPVRARLASALGAKTRPIVATSVVLAVGFGLFGLSPFGPVADYGLLSSLAMLTALASTLVLLPALLLVTARE